MVSTRPPPAPARGRIPYPSADTYAPGDAGAPPVTTIVTPPPTATVADPDRRGSGSSSDAANANAGPSGLRRLRSMRDRARGREPRDPSDQLNPPATAAARRGSLRRASGQSETSRERELSERERNMQGLKTWWKAFSTGQRPPAQQSFRPAPRTMTTRTVFGVPLNKMLSYASMQISTSAPDGSLFVWGEVPIVVAKCGAYLKDKTDIEGIFRVSGSAKRMRDLQAIFDEGPTFGADIEWDATNFSPHDVATIFRRYLTQMPEPVIPVAFYNHFRNVQTSVDLTTEMMIREYKRLIRKMPKENQYLLLYVLDLLGIVEKDSDRNLMTAPNLAVIFQPGILSHPGHDMRPKESALSKDVVEFLISHQHQFVVAMSMSMSSARRASNSHEGSAPPLQTETLLAVPETASPVLSSSPPLPSPTALAIPEVIPEDGQPDLQPTPSPGADSVDNAGAISPLSRPQPVRADTDYMVPSDSDDDAPAGGYYIVEKSDQPMSPRTSALTPSKTATMETADASFFVPALLAPPRPPRSAKRGRPSLPNLPSQGAVPVIDVMDPSDSDEDAPSGGYVAYENKRPASARPASASPSPLPTPNNGRGGLNRSRTVLQPADARTNSPKPPPATGLLRRRTLPTKRVSDFTARVRRAVREA